MNPTKQSQGNVTSPRLVDPRSPEEREQAICAAVSELITAEDAQEAVAAIRRGLKAQTTIRAPKKPGAESRNDYVVVDDVPSQLAAARLMLAYKFGNPASVLEMKLTPGTSPREHLTPAQMVEQLRKSGTDLNAIVNTWVNAAKRVEAEGGDLPPDLQKTVKAVEGIAVVDV